LLLRGQDKTVVLLSTFAMSIILFEAVLVGYGSQPESVVGVSGVLELGGVTITWQRILVLGAGIALLLILEYVLKQTKFGVHVRAVSQSAFAAQLVGVNLPRINSLTFAMASAIAGLGGALMAPVIVYSPMMGQAVITKTFVVVVMGGLGSVRGAVIFGITLGMLETFGSTVLSEGLATAVIYALLLAALLFRPYGLMGKLS
jgi:branched-chain amino acid transport system permease protein